MVEKISENLKQAARMITESDRVLVLSHVRPDGDAIGSMLAVAEMLRLLGKQSVLVNESPIPGKFHFLPGALSIRQPQDCEEFPPFSCVIAVDAADRERLGSAQQLLNGSQQVINIDHHPTNDHFGTINIVVPEAAATCEILYDLVEALELPWNHTLATCIYTGLLTDTGGFRYGNTTPQVLRRAANLLDHGVEGHKIADRVLESVTEQQLTLLRKALSTLSFSHQGQVAWMWLRNCTTGDADIEGIVNYARKVEGVEVGILFREIDDQTIRVSLRSRNWVDVGKLAQSFGGGGHARAAGCTIIGDSNQVEQRVLGAIATLLERKDQ